MNREALSWLGVVASALVGEPVRVQMLERDDMLGLAGRDAQGWYMALSAELGAADALKVLAHESAHLALGHIPRGAPSEARPVAGSPYRVWLDRRDEQIEREAQRWADDALARLSPQVRAVTFALLGEGEALRELVDGL